MAGYALVDEFCRAGQLQLHFFRRCQREFRDQVLPTLAFVDQQGGVEGLQAAIAERDELKAQVAKLTPKSEKRQPVAGAA